MERSAHYRPESRRIPAGPRYYRGSPVGWQRDHEHLQRLPQQGEQGLEGEGGRRHGAQLAGRPRGQGQPGRCGTREADAGSIGYVELIYALQNKMPYAMVQNKKGKFVQPSLAATSAAANIVLPDDMRVSLTDTTAAEGYPISGFTCISIRVHQKYGDKTLEKARTVGQPGLVDDPRRAAIRGTFAIRPPLEERPGKGGNKDPQVPQLRWGRPAEVRHFFEIGEKLPQGRLKPVSPRSRHFCRFRLPSSRCSPILLKTPGPYVYNHVNVL